jgi:DNA-binding IclR family transcriptional regulator
MRSLVLFSWYKAKVAREEDHFLRLDRCAMSSLPNSLPKLKPAPVGVLRKVFRIFDVLENSPAGLDLRKISQETGINKSTAYRFLAHLEREGYLIRDGAGTYVIGMKLFQLGARANPRAMLRDLARPVLRELCKATRETVNLAVLDQGAVLYLEVFESPHVFRLASTVGLRRPAYSTALGKALLASFPNEEREGVLKSLEFQLLTPHTIISLVQFKKELQNVSIQGYSIDDEENLLGARCIGAPILNSRGEAVAAISIAGPTTRISHDNIPSLAAAVMEAAHAIAARMGL